MSDRDVLTDAAFVGAGTTIAVMCTPGFTLWQLFGYTLASMLYFVAVFSWVDDLLDRMQNLNGNLAAQNKRLNAIKRKMR